MAVSIKARCHDQLMRVLAYPKFRLKAVQLEQLLADLLLWADHEGGWKVFGSSTGFCLPDGSVLSPDAILVRLDRW